MLSNVWHTTAYQYLFRLLVTMKSANKEYAMCTAYVLTDDSIDIYKIFGIHFEPNSQKIHCVFFAMDYQKTKTTKKNWFNEQ